MGLTVTEGLADVDQLASWGLGVVDSVVDTVAVRLGVMLCAIVMDGVAVSHADCETVEKKDCVCCDGVENAVPDRVCVVV